MFETSLEKAIEGLIAILTTGVNPSLISVVIFIFSLSKKKHWKIAIQEKIAIIIQRLKIQETEERREQDVLNCDSVLPNEIENQDRQPLANEYEAWLTGVELSMQCLNVYIQISKDLVVPW